MSAMPRDQGWGRDLLNAAATGAGAYFSGGGGISGMGGGAKKPTQSGLPLW